MGQQLNNLNRTHTDDILSFLPQTVTWELLGPHGSGTLGQMVGADATIQTSQMTGDFMNVLHGQHKQMIRLTIEIDDDWSTIATNDRAYDWDHPNLTVLVLRSMRHASVNAPVHITQETHHPIIERSLSSDPILPLPLEQWAPKLQTLDVTDVTFPKDVALVWKLFSHLERLQHFQIKSHGLNILCEYRGWSQAEFPVSATTIRIIVDPHIKMTLDSLLWIKSRAVIRSFRRRTHRIETKANMKLYFVIHKWTRNVQQGFLDFDKIINENDPMVADVHRFGHFDTFSLDIRGFESNLLLDFNKFHLFVGIHSEIHININARVNVDVSTIKWIASIVKELLFCKCMTVRVHVRCSTWHTEMIEYVRSIAHAIHHMHNRTHRERISSCTISSLKLVIVAGDQMQLEMDQHRDAILTDHVDGNVMDSRVIDIRLVGEKPQAPLKVKLVVPMHKRKRDDHPGAST
jgi:hypothetical protein